jgi:hypothetical protein
MGAVEPNTGVVPREKNKLRRSMRGDLPCSRNARSWTPLVGRAQSRIDQAALENEMSGLR